jgi:hypothetical protein
MHSLPPAVSQVGVAVLIVAVPAIATQHQPASWVFGSFETDLGYSVGLPNKL